MTRDEKARMEILKEMGVSVIDIRAGKHAVAKCRTSDGKEFSIGLAGSSGCWRGLKNFKSEVRKCMTNVGRNW